MSILTQYRLKCDYCGNVSPALDGLPHPLHTWPAGWQVYQETISPYPSTEHTFCTAYHREKFIAERKVKA